MDWVEYHTHDFYTSIPSKKSLSLFEVDLEKPRNLSGHESEECDHGEGVGILMWVCMLLCYFYLL